MFKGTALGSGTLSSEDHKESLGPAQLGLDGLKEQKKGYSDGLLVKSTGCPYRYPGFDSRHLLNVSKLPATSVPSDLMLSSDLHRRTQYRDIHAGKMPPHIK